MLPNWPALVSRRSLSEYFLMSFTGIVKDGVVVLSAEVKLPEGTAVKVEPEDTIPDSDPFLQAQTS